MAAEWPRRYVALLQDDRGYGTELEPAPPEGPAPPVLFTVVKADDHEADVERLTTENARLREGILAHRSTVEDAGEIRVADDESVTRAIRKGAADLRLWRLALATDEERNA